MYTHVARTLSLRVVGKPFEAVDEIGAVERIASDAYTRGLSEVHRCRLGHGLVRQGTRSRDHTNLPFLVDVSRHDPDFALGVVCVRVGERVGGDACVCVCARGVHEGFCVE